MDLSDLVDVPAILPGLKANSKKQLLQLLAERAASITGLQEREIFDTILQRERLGSTGVGNGIAIPHGKLAGVKRITGVFARLDTPVDFEALDDEPVDLVFLLLAPEGAGADHLKALSRIARDGHPRAAVRYARLQGGLTAGAIRTQLKRAASAALCRLDLQCRPDQWMLTGVRSFSNAPAMARSRASEIRIGWPFAANSAQSFVPGAISGRPGNFPFSSSPPISRR
jgi:PTS system nitrogen regulatory IIA component